MTQAPDWPACLESNVFPLPRRAGPGALLNARHGLVPFSSEGREVILDSLAAWAEDPSLTSVRLFTGPGGAGKTRLFIEECARLRARGWWAGFLRGPTHLTEASWDAVIHPRKAVLVVIDYAETRSDLRRLLDMVARRRGDPDSARLRIALLAREVADWWRSLIESYVRVGDLLRERDPAALPPITPEGEQRTRIFAHAFRAFSSHRGRSAVRRGEGWRAGRVR